MASPRSRHHHIPPHWRVDRTIPVSLIIAIAFQTGGAVWFASRMDFRVTAVEQTVTQVAPQGERLIRLETQLDAVRNDLKEVKQLLLESQQRKRQAALRD